MTYTTFDSTKNVIFKNQHLNQVSARRSRDLGSLLGGKICDGETEELGCKAL